MAIQCKTLTKGVPIPMHHSKEHNAPTYIGQMQFLQSDRHRNSHGNTSDGDTNIQTYTNIRA